MAKKAFIFIPRRKDKAMKFRQGKSACKSFERREGAFVVSPLLLPHTMSLEFKVWVWLT
jgi:hypothetical protein